ncbi:MAG TPA: hypothetical protein VL096_03130 [Pirellulaceae bacterium]|nr:hypothetical protein [Pirellulaceae bacterium]
MTSRTRYLLIIGGLLLSTSTGCLTPSGIVPPGWWQDWKDSAKAASGTSEHLGMSTQARDIERSLGNHRTRPIVSAD